LQTENDEAGDEVLTRYEQAVRVKERQAKFQRLADMCVRDISALRVPEVGQRIAVGFCKETGRQLAQPTMVLEVTQGGAETGLLVTLISSIDLVCESPRGPVVVPINYLWFTNEVVLKGLRQRMSQPARLLLDYLRLGLIPWQQQEVERQVAANLQSEDWRKVEFRRQEALAWRRRA
jgi:hypothetical protein